MNPTSPKNSAKLGRSGGCPLRLYLLTLGIAMGAILGVSCSADNTSPCHEMRKCVTLTCRDRLAEGISSESWRECVQWCRTSRGTPAGTHARCAEEIGVTCIRDWYGAECVSARKRCEFGTYREEPDRC